MGDGGTGGEWTGSAAEETTAGGGNGSKMERRRKWAGGGNKIMMEMDQERERESEKNDGEGDEGSRRWEVAIGDDEEMKRWMEREEMGGARVNGGRDGDGAA